MLVGYELVSVFNVNTSVFFIREFFHILGYFVVSSQIPWEISVHIFITSVAEILACSLTSVLGVKMIYVSLHGTFKGMSLI